MWILQGSCLGPLLFYIYINDLPNTIHNSKVYTYADHTCISRQTDNIPDLSVALNMDLEASYEWLNSNRLSLNVAKTQSMTIATKHKRAGLENQNEELNLQIHNKILEVVRCTKYLGVHIDYSLDWKKQIQETSKRSPNL